MLVDPNVDVANLSPEEHLTKDDYQLIGKVNNVYAHNNIFDCGYSGIIDKNHKEGILGIMIVNIVWKILLYIKEFVEGLKLNGIRAIRANPDVIKALLIPGNDTMDANSLFNYLSCVFAQRSHNEELMKI